MTMDLYNNDDYLTLTREAWAEALRTAEAYGWEPMGTRHHEEVDWSGGYLSNDSQEVTPEDSRGMALALERAVSDQGGKLAWMERLIDFLKAGPLVIG